MPNSAPLAIPSRGTRAGEIILWIESKCHVPEGALLGQLVRLDDWQKHEIGRIYNNPRRTRRAILSFARKNGKTALAAFLLLAHLCGPEALLNSNLFSTAQSREQAAQIFQYAAKTVRMSPELSAVIIVKDGAKELICPELGTRYRALSAEATTAFGLSPSFTVHDELGQVRGPRFMLYEALETATGAQVTPLSIIISTQAPTDADLLSVLIDDALAQNDPRVICSLYTAPMDADPFDIETIKLANPALGNFLNPAEVMDMADDARRMPAREPAYRNLILNQRVEASNPFITPALWKACIGRVPDFAGRTVYAGLDLSDSADLTALILIFEDGGKWCVYPIFWLPAQGLADKARADRVPYDTWAQQGHLLTTPGASVQYDYIARFLKTKVFDKCRVLKLGFDRWNMKHLKPWLLNAGFTEQVIEEVFVEFGQGTQSMSPALRDLEAMIRDGQIVHNNNPVMNMCAANAVVEGKPGEKVDAANRKLSKKRSTGRIDGMVGLTMAVGVAPLRAKPIDVAALIG